MTPRLLCPLPPAGGRHLASADQSHYLLKVLRLQPGAAIEIFDGKGLRFDATLASAEGKKAWLEAAPGRRVQPAGRHDLWLVQGLPSGDKMDWVIEKSVEIGVARLTPLQAERSIVRLAGPRLERKQAHWQAQIEAACMQSQRDDLMALDESLDSQAWFRTMAALPAGGASAHRFILDPAAPLHLLDALRSLKLAPDAGGRQNADAALSAKTGEAALSGGLIVMIGPESGFSDAELALARQAGFTPVHIGSQILRTETAGLVVCTKVQAWLEVLAF